MTTCIHCGTPFTATSAAEEFCCKGCECVHDLIQNNGFDRFYDLRQDNTIAPVKGRAFESPEFAWLDERITTAEATALAEKRAARLDCTLEGLSCVACVWLVEKLFERRPGAIRAITNPGKASLHLEWNPGSCDVLAFARELVSFGYTPAPDSGQPRRSESSGLAVRTGICGAFALNAMGFSLPTYLGMPDDFEFAELFRLITFLSATLSMLVGGSWFITRAWRALRARTLHIDLPIALGLLAAYFGSLAGRALDVPGLLYFDFVCTFIFLMLGGRWLQTLAVEKNRRRVARTSPVPESVLADGKPLPLSELKPGSRFELSPGRALPVASTQVSDAADVSLEWIHGESDPVATRSGATLPAGSILLSRSPITLLARETWQESILSRLTASPDSEKAAPFLGQILRVYLVAVLALGIGAWVFWFLNGQPGIGLQSMISVFVVSCPCALGIAIPLADERATRLASRAGVFVRHATVWFRLPAIRRVVFDKTGTLTLERPMLSEPGCVDALDETAALALARLTSGTCHPVARTLLEALGPRGQRLLTGSTSQPSIEETPGLGILLRDGGDTWSLGKPGWQAAAPATSTVLAKNGHAVASFHFTDTLRPGARPVISWLHRRGITTHILSGDSPEKVASMAIALDIPSDHAVGGLSPDDKASHLSAFNSSHDTLYLGDGANDSLAFDQAHVTGTPVADRSLLEKKSDFYTLGNALTWLPQLFAIARARTIGIRRTFAFTILYNLVAIVICLGGHMNPLLAAILMPLSSLASVALVSSSSPRRAQEKGVTSRSHGPKASPSVDTVGL